jgi:hypothetical protein
VAKNVSGSNRKFTVQGIPFNVAADANISETITAFENSMIASSGQGMRKMMKRIPVREGIVLLTNSAERELLIGFSEGVDDLQISYQNAAGDVFSCEGSLEIENNETEENRTSCQVQPRDGWTALIVP